MAHFAKLGDEGKVTVIDPEVVFKKNPLPLVAATVPGLFV